MKQALPFRCPVGGREKQKIVDRVVAIGGIVKTMDTRGQVRQRVFLRSYDTPASPRQVAQSGIPACDDLVVPNRQAQVLDFGDYSAAIMAGCVGQIADRTPACTKLIKAFVSTRYQGFADIQHAERIKDKCIDLVCYL